MARRRDEQNIDQFNQSLRSNEGYREFLRSMGVNPDGRVRLSDSQRKSAENWIRRNVADIGKLEVDPAGNINQNEGFGKQAKKWGPIAGAAAAAAFGVPGLFPGLLTGGGTAAGTGGLIGTGLEATPNIASAAGLANAATLPGFGAAATGLTAPMLASGITGAASGAGGAATGAEGVRSGMMGGLFGRNGLLDPTSLILGGLSLIGGGDDDEDNRVSFEGTGADAVKNLEEALASIRGMGKSLQERDPFSARSSVVNNPFQPVDIPGLPFQIGGGLATDPALRDPSLLQARRSMFNIFGAGESGGSGGNALPRGDNPGARRRVPRSFEIPGIDDFRREII